jgi:hypothetical protein
MERRRFQRLPAEAEVVVRAQEGPRRATGRNISGNGILFSSPTRFEEGKVLDIEVITATHRAFTRVFRPLLARVRVVRVRGDQAPFEVAAEFLSVER